MEYNVVSLGELIDEEVLDDIVNNFSVKRNKDVESFLKKKAKDFERKSIARTYLIFNSEPLEILKDRKLIAYFTISNQYMLDLTGVSNTFRKKITGSKLKKKNEYPTTLIGQLARNDTYSNKEFSGDQIILEALKKCLEVHYLIGGRYIAVECKKELVKFYAQNSFSHFKARDCENNEIDCLQVLIAKIDDIKKYIAI